MTCSAAAAVVSRLFCLGKAKRDYRLVWRRSSGMGPSCDRIRKALSPLATHGHFGAEWLVVGWAGPLGNSSSN